MNKFLTALSLSLSTTLVAPLAQAQQANPYYGGLTVTKSGSVSGISRTGERVTDKGRVGFKLYGGWNFTDNLALEGGYADYGSFTLKNTGPGTTGDGEVTARLAYVAVRASAKVSDNFSVFGKLGLAHSRFDRDGLAGGDVSMTRPTIGVGLQYNMTEKLAVTLELNKYGRKQTGPTSVFNVNALELGLKYKF